MPGLFDPASFASGKTLKNRFALAPMTNCQSHADGSLSEDEHDWLAKRATGGFGLVMTCAAHVQATGQGFPGQLGVFADRHVAGLTRLADTLRAADCLSIVQLHHSGRRAPESLTGQQPVCPSDDEETGARALTTVEVEGVVGDFIAAAVRAQRAGFDGVELHGAHDYLLCEFLSAETNQRRDRYGGSAENRARILIEILAGVRRECRQDFLVGVRLSPERYGIVLEEMRQLTARLASSGVVDFLDLSLWDVRKEAEDERYRGRSLMSYFTDLDLRKMLLGVAGKIQSSRDAEACLDAGVDFVLLGKAAILHHDFPRCVLDDDAFEIQGLPVSRDYLRREGLGEAFIDYLERWPDFVSPEGELSSGSPSS